MFRRPIAKVSPADESPWADLEAAADDLEAGTEMSAAAYDSAWTNVLRDESPVAAARDLGPGSGDVAGKRHGGFDARLHLPLGALATSLETSSSARGGDTPGTGSTKRAPSARRKREQREKAKPRRQDHRTLHSVAGVSLAQRMIRTSSETPRGTSTSPTRALSPAREPSPPRATEKPARSGLSMRLSRANAAGVEGSPRLTESALSPTSGVLGPLSPGNLNALCQDKQLRAEKRKEANKALRRKKREEAAHGTFSLGPATSLLAAH